MAFGKKIYGESKRDACPFCGKQATTKNWQKVTVCRDHTDAELPDLKCVCGEYLDVKEGKFGYFFLCMNCGPLNVKKGFDMNNYAVGSVPNANKNTDAKSSGKPFGNSAYSSRRSFSGSNSNESIVRSDDPRYFS